MAPGHVKFPAERPAVRCIAWLDDSLIAELLVHGKAAEVSATALDELLAVELEAMAVEEWPRRETSEGGNFRDVNRAQCGLDAMVKAAGNTATGERGMSEKKVEVAVVGVASETREHPVRLGDDSVKTRKTLLPSYGIGWDWSPRRNLLRRVVGRSQ
jgi:hypothetical protein